MYNAGPCGRFLPGVHRLTPLEAKDVRKGFHCNSQMNKFLTRGRRYCLLLEQRDHQTRGTRFVHKGLVGGPAAVGDD